MIRMFLMTVTWLLFTSTSSALGQAPISMEKNRYEFSPGDISLSERNIDGLSFQIATLRGANALHAIPGHPELPVIRFYTFGEVKVEVGSTRVIETSMRIAPYQPSVEKRPGATQEFIMNEELYESTAAYPALPGYSVEPAGSIRGQRRSLVTLYPLSVIPNSGELVLRENIAVEITGKQQAKDTSNHIAFVVANKFADSAALNEYRSFKESLGHSTSMILYGRDVSSVNGIRRALQQELADNELRFAVLVGDFGDLPAHRARHMNGYTDHYFRAIDTANYESDINGPDIGVGRISVRSEEELQQVVDKYIRYQQQPSIAMWEAQISFLATSDRSFYRVAEGTHNYVIDSYTRETGYVGNFPNARTLGGDQLYAISHGASGSDALRSIRQGRNFVTFSGHGYTGGWAGPAMTTANVLSLDNDSIPLVLGFACDTGDYRGSQTFAEAWQRHPSGAILYWGSYDSSYWDEDDILEKALFDSIFAGTRTISDFLDYSMQEVWAHYGGRNRSKYYWETYTSFADPSVAIRVAHPDR